jgi:hypothetical protein
VLQLPNQNVPVEEPARESHKIQRNPSTKENRSQKDRRLGSCTVAEKNVQVQASSKAILLVITPLRWVERKSLYIDEISAYV